VNKRLKVVLPKYSVFANFSKYDIAIDSSVWVFQYKTYIFAERSFYCNG